MDTSELFVYGRQPVRELLHRSPSRVSKLYVREHLNPATLQELYSLCSFNKIPVTTVPGRKLLEMVGKVNDQGIVALISPVHYHDFDDWMSTIDLQKKPYPFILLLDEIEDPNNFGAILRTAAAAGAAGVIIPKHRQSPVTPAVFKTSAGTAGFVPIMRVTNLNQTILQLKDIGFWIYGLDQNAGQLYWQEGYDRPVAIVIGSEGKGIRHKTLDHCDFTVRIPMENNVESLNASVSAALLCYEISRKRNEG